mgnify:CR=1 FL=1
MTTNELVAYAVTAMEDKKGTEISVIDIVSDTNQKQTQAIADEIEEKLAKHEVFPRQKEGYAGGTWILLDYQDVVIHIFNGEDRRFYNLERIWADGITVDPKTFHISEE